MAEARFLSSQEVKLSVPTLGFILRRRRKPESLLGYLSSSSKESAFMRIPRQ